MPNSFIIVICIKTDNLILNFYRAEIIIKLHVRQF